MGIFTWWSRKKIRKTDSQLDRDTEKDVCPECGGKGCTINDNHYVADNDYEYNDYERQYSSCKRCHGTGRYHSI